MARVFRGVLHAIVLTVAASATNARADIDATGNWLITVTDLGNTQFTQQWIQTGSVLAIDGNDGTIDPQSGVFSVAFTPNPLDPCSGGSEGGTVAPEGQSFTGYIGVCGDTPTLCCFGGGGGLPFSVVGSRIPCGNGVVEPGEQCDDGNLTPGDGCSPLCQVEPCYSCSGQPSVCSPLPEGNACDDGNPCTLNACNASGACVVTGSAPQGSPCDDGNLCTANACDGAGTCAVTNPSISCDDGNPCTLDQCFPSQGCVHPAAPYGWRCDVDLCTEDICDGGGSCVFAANIDCSDGDPCTVDSCDPQLGCQHASDVRSCRTTHATQLVIKDGATASKDKRLWKWAKGDATAVSDFGTPPTTTSYALCVFAGTTAAVVGSAQIPPGAQTWSAIGQHGFKYKDPGGSAGGITNMTLLSGAAGKAKVIVKGKGAGLPLTPPPYALPLTIQMTNSSTNACWASTFGTADVKRNATDTFHARSKSP